MEVETVQFEQNEEKRKENVMLDNEALCYSAQFVEDSFIAETSDVGSESGLGQDYAEWVFDSEEQSAASLLLDLSNEQALATLKYFTSTADRTNMMTKFHGNDLDLISQLLADKEKDLTMAAQIGQSLLQRNKTLMEKIEKMEDYLNTTKENEEQLKYDLQQKSDLVKMYYQEEDEMTNSLLGSTGSQDESCEDEELLKLTKKCRDLEKANHNLFSEALNLREMTDDIEEKEESLVLDCIEQLSSAKSQISNLTDEIAQKFEDNVQQQEEITQLINMVVELQKKQKQLSAENEELQTQLMHANENENNLKDQLLEMQAKFRETYEMLQENQQEMKALKSKIEYPGSPTEWLNDSSNSLSLHDSLANEIEESVRRDLTYAQESKNQTNKVLENVKLLNTRNFDGFSSRASTSGRTSPSSNWSFASDERSDTTSTAGLDVENRTKKPARKLQIVKPMEGSDTLNKWHHLASQNVVGGLNITEGETSPNKIESQQSIEDDISTVAEDESKSVSMLSTNSTVMTEDNDEIKITPKKLLQEQKKPQVEKSLFNLLNAPSERKRTIITRNSAALNSLRKGRRMLTGQDTEGKTKSEVIDMIASAMSKVNVEAQAGERILTSLKSETKSGRERALSESKSPELKDFKDMPHVSKVLEKASKARESEESSEATLSPDHLKTIEEDNNRILPDNALNSISGPLGLLNRANPTDGNENILDRLHRFSGAAQTTAPKPRSLQKALSIDKVSDAELDSGISVADSTESTGIRRNKSSGSLVDIMLTNKLQSGLRPLGMASLVNVSSTSALSSSAHKDNTTSQSIEGLNSTPSSVGKLPTTSKSVETGLDNVQKGEATSTPTGGYGGLFSFLGRFS